MISRLDSGVRSTTEVLVIGASYGGLAAALNLLDLCSGKIARSAAGDSAQPAVSPINIAIVDERDGFYHVISSPLSLTSEEYSPKAWREFSQMPALQHPSISYRQGRVKSVDCERKVATIVDIVTGTECETFYDYLVVSTGLRRVWPVVPQSLTKVDYLVEAGEHVKAIKAARDGVVVVGGGAVGIEMAAELKLVEPNQTVKLIHSRDKLLSSEPLPDEFKEKSLLLLQEAGVEVMLGRRVMKVIPDQSAEHTSYTLILSDGTQMKAGHVISAISNGVPSTSFLPSKALDPNNFVKINSNLNIQDIPNSLSHYSIGDIDSWSGIKRCGTALHMGYQAAFNIHQQILQAQTQITPKFKEFPEVPPMIIIAVGKQAVSYGTSGMHWGQELMETSFGDDLWLSKFFAYLKLDESEGIKNHVML